MPDAAAHGGTSAAVAADYEARLAGVRPSAPGVAARAIGGDIKLSLHVAPNVEVVVIGVSGEPFLRFADGDVLANRRSPTAAELRIVTLDVGAAGENPEWVRVRGGRSYSWHESRLRPVARRRAGRIAAIEIPLRIDGRPSRLVGSSWYAPPPALWPWVVLGLLPVSTLALVDRVRRVWLEHATVPLGLLALSSFCACVIGRSLYGPDDGPGTTVQIAAVAALGVIGLAGLLRAGRGTRPLLAAGVGLLTTLYAAESLTVLTHGFVFSRLPADADRAGTVLALGCGVSLIALLIVGRLRELDAPGRGG